MEPISKPNIATEILVRLYAGQARSKALIDSITTEFDISEPTAYALLKELQERGLVERNEYSSRNVQYALTSSGRESVENSYLKFKEGLIKLLHQTPERDIILLDVFISDVEKRLMEKNLEISPETNLRKVLFEVGRPLIDNMKKMLYEQTIALVEAKLLEHHALS